MASQAQIEAIARAALDIGQSIQTNTKTPSQLSSASRLSLLDAVYPRILNNGYYWRTYKGENTNYSAFEIGDVIREIDDVNKVSYVGKVLNASLTLPADFNNPSKIELYNQDGAAI